MPERFAKRIQGLVQSDIRRMSRECERLGGINLGQGICDQEIEPPIREAVQEALSAGHSQYSPLEGIARLRGRIAEKAESYNGIPCDKDTQIVVTVGSTGAFAVACLALLEPGDEVVVFSPFYAYHVNLIKVCGAKPVCVRLEPPDWSLDEGALASAFSDRTRMVVVNTPCNPCGKVFSEEELKAVGELARRRGALVLTDEIYEYIVFDGRKHVSMASLPSMAERTITISGFSKTYSMTGWRLGYAIAPEEISRKMGLLNDLLYVCAPTPLQHAVATAFDLPASYYEELRRSYQVKRDLIAGACERAGMPPYVPEGAYYLLADVSRLGCDSDREAAEMLLTRAGVASVPGGSFYADPEEGRRQVRFCFAKKLPDLEEACRRIEALGAAAG